MAVIACTQCDWVIQQDELWDERAEEHFLETNHSTFITHKGVHLPSEGDF